jgi:hypothetical protein
MEPAARLRGLDGSAGGKCAAQYASSSRAGQPCAPGLCNHWRIIDNPLLPI